MLQVRLFGCFAIEHVSARHAQDLGRSGRRLASYLFSYPNRSHRREKLIDLFWTHCSPDQGRAGFSTALWKIRRALEGARDESALCVKGQTVSIEVHRPTVVDAHRFACETAGALALSEGDRLGRAVDLYGGSFLEEYDDDWVLEERERLEALYVRALTQMLVRYAHAGAHEEALDYARRILATDPMRETAQRAAMLLYTLNGQRGHALRQFQRCRSTLQAECGVDPMPETRALEALIRSGEVFGRLRDLQDQIFGNIQNRG